MDCNRWNGVGRLTKRPEFFPPGPRGEEHATFTLAVNRVVPGENGPAVDYIPCSVWGEEARKFCEIRNKGDEVSVKGRLRTSFVPQASGKSTFFWEVRVHEVQYGRVALKNLSAPVGEDKATRAVQVLTKEYGA